jgi:Holliday junction DNA helicase RuvA
VVSDIKIGLRCPVRLYWLEFLNLGFSIMIAFLSGKLLAKHPGSLIIDVQGVGYEVSIPLSTFYEVGEVNAEVQLHIYTHVREDALQLFGFQTRRDRELYMQLISVSGVGAKMAIAMLSAMNADEIILAVRTENLAKLTAIPGIGRKTAERLVIELRDKVVKMLAPETEGSGLSDAKEKQAVDLIYDDALSALLNLGYQRQAAEKALKSAVNDGTEVSVQKLLRKSLQLLAKG